MKHQNLFVLTAVLCCILTGSVFAGNSFLLDTSAVYIQTVGSGPVVDSDGNNFLAVWDDSKRGGIYGVRITGDGVLLDPSGFEIAVGDAPCLAYNGSVYLVVWERSETSFDVYAARVSIDGQVLDPDGIEICTAAANQINPRITSNGSDWLICWEDERNGGANNRDIYGSRVNSNGQVLDPDGFPISTAANRQESVSLVFGGNNYLVVWDDARTSDSLDVYGARVSTDGNVLDPNGILICSAALSQYVPSVSFDGTNYFVVWSDDRLNLWYTDIYGTRVNQNGSVLDPGGIPLFTGSHWEEYTAIEFDGANYLITWEDYRTGYADIYGGRVTPSGTVLDPGGFAICTAGEEQYNNNCGLAYNGNLFLSVWEDERNNPSSAWYIYAARINTSGIVLDPTNFCLSFRANEQFAPSAVFDGTNYFAVWEDTKFGTSDILGAKYNSSGELLSPGLIVICNAANDQKNPAVSFDGTNYVVVWQDNRTGSNYGIYAARVDQSGNVLDPSSIAVHWGGYAKEYPDIVFDGTNFLIVYQTFRSGYNREIYAIKLSPDGTILTPGGFDISLSFDDEYDPKVAFDGTNNFVVWADNRNTDFDVFGARVDLSGVLIDSSGILINSGGFRPEITYYGNNYFVVWEEQTGVQEAQIYGARVNVSGVVLDPQGINISNQPGMNMRPTVATDGTKFVVVWESFPFGGYSECDIKGAWVDLAGVVTQSFIITSEKKRQNNPSILYSMSDRFLITYEGWCSMYQGTSFNTSRVWGKNIDDSVPVEKEIKTIPAEFILHQNYPNPFNPSTVITYQLPVSGDVTLKVYDLLGREVATLVDEYKAPGKYEVEFSVSSGSSFRLVRNLSSGIYFYQLRAGEFIQTKKMILIK